MDKAYVCTCSILKKRKYLWNKESCPCRELSTKETSERFKQMFTKYKEGEAVLRIKTDLENKDPALRDWPAFRIVNNASPFPSPPENFIESIQVPLIFKIEN